MLKMMISHSKKNSIPEALIPLKIWANQKRKVERVWKTKDLHLEKIRQWKSHEIMPKWFVLTTVERLERNLVCNGFVFIKQKCCKWNRQFSTHCTIFLENMLQKSKIYQESRKSFFTEFWLSCVVWARSQRNKTAVPENRKVVTIWKNDFRYSW